MIIKIDDELIKAIKPEIDEDKQEINKIKGSKFDLMTEWTFAKCFPAIYNEKSRILFLGTITPKTGRQNGFYYTSKDNMFWDLLNYSLKKDKNDEDIFNIKNIDSLKEKLFENNIAIADTVKTCIRKSGQDDGIILYQLNEEIIDVIFNSDIDTILCTNKNGVSSNLKKIFEISGKLNYKKPITIKNKKTNEIKTVTIVNLSSPSKSNLEKGEIEQEWKQAILTALKQNILTASK